MIATSYLRHIDGLRAVAVLAVVFFHAEFPIFSGGFVGVDIFFVISGFLISRLIILDTSFGNFSFIDFYVRRIKRLLPVYFLVLFAATCVVFTFYMPSDLRSAGASLLASGFFSTNILFWQQGGYFDTQSDLKPLLHTWSLSVEEQFYLIFPLCMFFLFKIESYTRFLIVIAILLISLALSQLLLTIDPGAAFYLLPSRAFEFLIGTVLALWSPKRPAGQITLCLVAVVGFASMLLPVFFFDPTTSFPGVAAVLPCIGAAVIIWIGEADNSLTRRIIENKPMVLIGKMSYSLYLWHWFYFSTYRYINIDRIETKEAMSLILVSLATSFLSWKYIEQPFRGTTARARRAFGYAILTSIFSICIGGMIYRSAGLPQRFDKEVLALLTVEGLQGRRSGCMSSGTKPLNPSAACQYGKPDAVPDTAVWGDSHAHAIVDALGQQLGQEGRALKFFGAAGCLPIIGVSISAGAGIADCFAYSRSTIEYLKSTPSIRNVILAARYSAYLKGPTDKFGPSESAANRLTLKIVEFGHLKTFPFEDAFWSRFEATVRILVASRKNVIISLPVPEVAYNVPETLALLKFKGKKPENFTRPRAIYEARQGDIVKKLTELSAKYSIQIVDPAEFLCNSEFCITSKNGIPLYYDDDHLSKYGASMLSIAIIYKTKSGIPKL